MAKMTFRFSTECEMELSGTSYEDIYLKFKDFMHGNQHIARQANLKVCPPESVQVFFEVEHSGHVHEIEQFKGSYETDIRQNCETTELMIPQKDMVLATDEGEFHTVWSVSSH
ncbi:hypothetical protein G8764_00085 [Pseudomaricurvus alcaniphilus]|uniref:hypothetical protein n=1 Tax=Pseudomaricurvus alcaniphilus TaxID=1166482 RepID=UPI00140E0CB3|nr:hypothetical protein [Pseudomaricurvus alcaniphilus]NHN35687.1 hypothetical protein [Pseudomaricurvus alcaniphilus]